MGSLGQVGKGEKPNHPGMGDGKFIGSKVGEDSEQGMFPGCRIDVDRVTGDPGKYLGVGGHRRSFSSRRVRNARAMLADPDPCP